VLSSLIAMELLLLGIVAGLGIASYSLLQRRGRRAPEPRRLAERTLTTLQVGDVVQHLGGDYAVEGVLTLSVEGRGRRIYRLVDGGKELFLFVPAPTAEPVLLERSSSPVPEGAPEHIEERGVRYRMAARHSGSVISVGEMRIGKGRERVKLYEYAGAASDRLLLLDWGGEGFDLLAGKIMLTRAFELLPGR
jgi:hypothetical protein